MFKVTKPLFCVFLHTPQQKMTESRRKLGALQNLLQTDPSFYCLCSAPWEAGNRTPAESPKTNVPHFRCLSAKIRIIS